MTPPFRVAQAGDAALIVVFADDGGHGDGTHAVAVAEALRRASLAGVIDLVPTSHSVGIYLDPLRAPADIESHVARVAAAVKPAHVRRGTLIEVPVCYGGSFGPDLDDLAAFARISPDDVIAMHAAATYRVQMLGFAPGFAYMAAVDPRIAMPRRSTPRLSVPAGSVGIAGSQTGVYPLASPGGWQIIGRTPLRVTDFDRERPFLFTAGDTVRFRPIDAAAFAALAAEPGR
jgi:inhibitor of KinA